MKPLLCLWRLLDSRQRRSLGYLQVLAAAMAGSTLLGVASMLPFLAVVADPAQLDHFPWLAHWRASWGLDDRQLVIALGAGFVGIVVFTNAINLLGTLMIARFAFRVGDQFHAALLREYLRRDYLFHVRTGSARLFNRVVFITNRVAHGILESGMLLLANAAVAVLILASIFWVDAWVAAVAVIWLGGGYLALYVSARRRLLRNGAAESVLIDARSRIANDALASIRDVKLRGAESQFGARFETVCRSIARITLDSQFVSQAPRYAMECLTVAGLVAAALFLNRSAAGAGWMAQLSFLGFAAYRLLPAVQQVFVSLVRIRANRALFEEVADDLARALAPSTADALSLAPWVPVRDIALDRVSFGYAPGAPVLRGLSLCIPVGALVGIAGTNGSGKSTVLDLLLGFHEPDSGQLRVDGVEVNPDNRTAWQRSLSFVPQTTYLLNGTLAQNIAFGVPAGQVDRERLRAAAAGARLLAWVESLPAGFEQRVGDGARELSGGERQRVAIARALYHDCPVLLMDEPTSWLDCLTEQEFLELLRGLRGDRTIVFVTHRPNALRECDLVYELEEGVARMRASPPGLMKAGAIGATR